MTELAPPRPRVSAAGFPPDAAGVTAPANPDRHGGFLADVVVELGFADRETVEAVEEEARRAGQTIEQALRSSGALDEEQLALATAERNGLDHVDLDRFAVDMEAAAMIAPSAALRYRAVPIAFAADGALIVAVEDPYNSLGINDVEAIARSEVRPVIAAGSRIRALIERLPVEPALHAPPPPPPPEPEPEPEPVAETEVEAEAEEETAVPEAVVEESPIQEAVMETEERSEPMAPPRPEPIVSEGDERRDRAADLEALRQAVRQADALAGVVGRRIEELEGAGERAQELERELAAARERMAALEQRHARVVAASAEAAAAIEKLGALRSAIEETG